jgi:hypothetical protein
MLVLDISDNIPQVRAGAVGRRARRRRPRSRHRRARVTDAVAVPVACRGHVPVRPAHRPNRTLERGRRGLPHPRVLQVGGWHQHRDQHGAFRARVLAARNARRGRVRSRMATSSWSALSAVSGPASTDAARHGEVPERLGRHRAEPEEGHRERPQGARGQRGRLGSGGRRNGGRAGVASERHLLTANSDVHGRHATLLRDRWLLDRARPSDLLDHHDRPVGRVRAQLPRRHRWRRARRRLVCPVRDHRNAIAEDARLWCQHDCANA